jgi:hypothetical protein
LIQVKGMHIKRSVYLGVAAVALVICLRSMLVSADELGIQVTSASAESHFPDGILFRVEANAPDEIESIIVRFTIPERSANRYQRLDLMHSKSVSSELLMRTDTNARYIPPGTRINYRFELEDSNGRVLITETQSFVYTDVRYDWKEISRENVTVMYYGPVQRRAEAVLDAALETIEIMGPVLGVSGTRLLRLTMYNNWPTMSQALPPTSRVVRNSLITEGAAFSEFGVILVLGDSSKVEGVSSHEVVHYLVHEALGSAGALVPVWLNEGLAEYGNTDPGISYDTYLAIAIARDQLMPLTSLNALPGDPQAAVTVYGQGRSVVGYLIETYGVAKIQSLLRDLGTGLNIDSVLMNIYGFDRIGLDSEWRAYIGAAPLSLVPVRERVLPTPVPWPTIVPFGVVTATPGPDSTRTPGFVAVVITPPAGDDPSPAPKAARACSRADRGVAALDLAALGVLLGGLTFVARRR